MTLYYKYVLLLYMYTVQFVYICTLTQCSKCIICESHIYAFMIGIETITNSNPHCSISQYIQNCMMRQFYLYVTILIIRNSVTLNFSVPRAHMLCCIAILHDYTISTLQSHAHVLHASDMHTTIHYCTLLYTTIHYCTLLYTAVHYYTLLYTTVHYCTLLYTTAHYRTLLYTTVHYCTHTIHVLYTRSVPLFYCIN